MCPRPGPTPLLVTSARSSVCNIGRSARVGVAPYRYCKTIDACADLPRRVSDCPLFVVPGCPTITSRLSTFLDHPVDLLEKIGFPLRVQDATRTRPEGPRPQYVVGQRWPPPRSEPAAFGHRFRICGHVKLNVQSSPQSGAVNRIMSGENREARAAGQEVARSWIVPVQVSTAHDTDPSASPGHRLVARTAGTGVPRVVGYGPDRPGKSIPIK